MCLCKVDFSFVLKEKLPRLVLFLYLFWSTLAQENLFSYCNRATNVHSSLKLWMSYDKEIKNRLEQLQQQEKKRFALGIPASEYSIPCFPTGRPWQRVKKRRPAKASAAVGSLERDAGEIHHWLPNTKQKGRKERTWNLKNSRSETVYGN